MMGRMHHQTDLRGGDGITRAGTLVFKDVPRLLASYWVSTFNWLQLLNRERKYGRRAQLAWSQRVALWRAGFLSESAVIYRRSDPRQLADYLPDAARVHRTGALNRPFDLLLNDKLCFWAFVRHLSDRVSPTLGIVHRGRLARLGSPGDEPLAAGLPRLGAKLVLKTCTGSGGTGVATYEWRDGRHILDGRGLAGGDLARALGGEARIVSPYVRQAAYARDIFPDVANTIRILTMHDAEAGEAFVAGAVHRFGVRQAGVVVDNWSQGGISAGIDPETGRLTAGYPFPSGGELRRHPAHPDTGAAIEGVEVPGWPRLRDEIAGLAARLPFLPYVGWDVIVTDEGYVIIEGNNRPDVNLMQVHQPLLANGRARRFYERHGVVQPDPGS